MATERGFESHETRQGSITALVQAALAGANRAFQMVAEARAKGERQEAWHQELERAAAAVAVAGVRVEAASQESRAAVTGLEAAIVALEVAKQSARPASASKLQPPPPPPQQSARPVSAAEAQPPPPPSHQSVRPASASKLQPPPPPPQQSARPVSAAKAQPPPPPPHQIARPASAATARPPPPPPLPLPHSKCVRLECGNAMTGAESGSKCALGHALCTSCTTQYVKATLFSQGTVRWDKIVCMGPECTACMGGASVRHCISHELVASIDAAQPKAVPSVGPEHGGGFGRAVGAGAAKFPEHDRASEAAVVELFKPCPKCKVPTEKVGGSDHMTCVCQHEYYWSCQCVYPTARHVSCVPR